MDRSIPEPSADDVDSWLEELYEIKTHLPDEDDPEFQEDEDHWFDWDDEEELDDDTMRRTFPSGFVPLDRAIDAPLQTKINDAITTLSEQLANGHTQAFHDLMRFYAKLHTYSVPNTLLIWLQKPDANALAGYRTWQQLGRQVRKGAKSAQIWCPVFRKQEDEQTGEEARRLVGFRTGYVFSDRDLEDIDTNPLPTDRLLLPDNRHELLALLKEKVKASGVGLREVDHIAGAHGYYKPSTHEITLEQGRDSHNQSLVLLHEWAHALFHHNALELKLPKAQIEFEAETTAMVMGSILGLDAPAAADYLLSFGATPEQLSQSFGRIHRLVGEMAKHLGLNDRGGESDE